MSLEVLAGALFLPSEDLYNHGRIPLARASLDIGLVGLGPMLPTWLTCRLPPLLEVKRMPSVSSSSVGPD